MKPPYLDYSQYRTWLECQMKWYELAVLRRRRKFEEGHQRDDALAMGTLVHAGLQVWQERRVIGIPPEVVEKIVPTKAALDACYMMLTGYAQRYPAELWPLVRCEKPLRFPLMEGMDGLAKVDEYFYVPVATEVQTGLQGETQWLSPGWWVQEYKTKSPEIDIALWLKKWEVNQQVSFQIFALEAMIQGLQQRDDTPDYVPYVQGVLVTVIEKPKVYVPLRGCKVCERKYEFHLWLPTGEGLHACPVCGNHQKLLKLKEDPVERGPVYYRRVVTRGREQLQKDFSDFQSVAREMLTWREEPLEVAKSGLVWNKELCVDTSHRRVCPWFEVHTYGGDTRVDQRFEDCEDYVGELEELEEEG